MSEYRKTLALNVRWARRQAHMSQADLALRLGIDKTAVSRIETGQRGVSAEELARIADVFGVSTDGLLGRVDDGQAVPA